MPAARAALVLAVALALAAIAAGCGSDEHELTVKEGEPIELDDLSYNVQITRLLNPADGEDKAYLAGQPNPPRGKEYLGVFMQVHNEGDSPRTLPRDFIVRDTGGKEFEPVPSESLFALELGGRMKADATAPEPESTAANGVIQGAMVLFLVNADVTESRPLTLDIPSSSGGEVGEVELDI
jgi:hypothetical protein